MFSRFSGEPGHKTGVERDTGAEEEGAELAHVSFSTPTSRWLPWPGRENITPVLRDQILNGRAAKALQIRVKVQPLIITRHAAECKEGKYT